MKSMDQCEEQGAIVLSSKRIKRLRDYLGFECLEGKYMKYLLSLASLMLASVAVQAETVYLTYKSSIYDS